MALDFSIRRETFLIEKDYADPDRIIFHKEQKQNNSHAFSLITDFPHPSRACPKEKAPARKAGFLIHALAECGKVHVYT